MEKGKIILLVFGMVFALGAVVFSSGILQHCGAPSIEETNK